MWKESSETWSFGNQPLPLPLTREEEEQYVQQWKQGDVEARDVLVVHNLRFVLHTARRLQKKPYALEDLVSSGLVGLTKALDAFKPERGYRFLTLAKRCIENEILLHYRRNKRHENVTSLDQIIHCDEKGSEFTWMDCVAAAPDMTGDDEWEWGDICDALQQLSLEDRQLLTWRYGLDGSTPKMQKEVAQLLCLSQSYISRREKRALKRVRKLVETNVFKKEQSAAFLGKATQKSEAP